MARQHLAPDFHSVNRENLFEILVVNLHISLIWQAEFVGRKPARKWGPHN
jgi:hypothetical protein